MPLPRSIRLILAVVLVAVVAVVAVVALVGVAVFDHVTSEEPTYEALSGTTVLDSWQPSWADPTEPDAEEGSQSESSQLESSVSEEPVAEVFGGCGAGLPRRWMVIGWDAAEWRLLLPLMEAGELPNFERLLRSGTHGNLASFLPSISPAIWTTVATGVPPSEHGIRHFYNQRPRLERWWSRLKNFGQLDRHLFSNADRRAPAIWNQLSDRGRRVMTVGYHNTFPVEEISGLMVSNYLMQDSIGELMNMRADGGDASPFALSLVYPQEHLDRVLQIQDEVNRGLPEAIRQFADLDDEATYRKILRASRELPEEGDQRPYFLARAYVFDEIAARAAESFYDEIAPDLWMAHFQSLDWAAHQFLYFHEPDTYADMPWDEETRRQLEAQQSLYEGTVPAFYRYMDGWLGRFLALRGDDTAVLLLSDHGVGPGPDPAVPGYHDDGPPGVIVLAGPGIRRGHRLEGATIYDILPTLMAALELPVAEDLPGRTLDDAFCSEAWSARRQETIASYQSGERFVPEVAKPPELDSALIDQLESLGYIK